MIIFRIKCSFIKNETQCKVMYGNREMKTYLRGKSFDFSRNKRIMSTSKGWEEKHNDLSIQILLLKWGGSSQRNFSVLY